MNERNSIQDGLAFGIIAVGSIIFILIILVIIIMLSARRLKLKQELAQSQLTNRLLESQFSALRSQMNPHFIFNCLNSIRLFTEQNNGEAASIYLGKFSSLIRCTLDNARTEKVTLSEEIRTLALYVDLELLRFKNKFTFLINVAAEVDQDFIEVPPMIIQPIVENAIMHGLVNKNGIGKLQIDITYDDPQQEILKIGIQDDGIGREAASKLKVASHLNHKSHGLEITKERLELLHTTHFFRQQFFITNDLRHADGTIAGTEVIMKLPIG